MSWRLTFLVAFLFFLSAFASFKDPSLIQECANNCTCERTLSAVLIESRTYDEPFVHDLVSSLLAREGNAVLICLSGNSRCSFPLTSTTDAIIYLRDNYNDDYDFFSEDLIQAVFKTLAEYNSEALTMYQQLPTMGKKLIMVARSDQSSTGKYALMAKQAGYEIFGLGYFEEISKFSYPLSHHLFAGLSEQSLRRLLHVLRGDTSDFCAIYGFGVSHVLSMDGSAYDVPGFGEYTLFSSLESAHPLLVQIRQTPRESGENSGVAGATEIRAVALRDASLRELEFLFDPFADVLSLLISGQPVLIDQLDTDEGGRRSWDGFFFFTITKRSPYGGYEIQVSNGDGAVVNIDFSNYGSGVVVFPNTGTFGRVEGLCGSYDACARNDFTLPDGSAVDYDLFYSEKKAGQAARESFIEQWRVPDDGLHPTFTHEGFEVYKPLPDWKPLKSAPGFGRSKEFCADLPAVLNEACLFDVGARENLYASWFSHHLFSTICSRYCEDGSILPYAFLDAASLCSPLYCAPTSTDLHRTYNTTNLPDLVLRGSSDPKALFKPAINLGGVYTFRFTANDLCDDQSREIKVTIKCDPAPKVSTLDYVTEEGKTDRAPNITTSISMYGYPAIHFFASVTPVGNPENLRFSWKAINATLPLDEDSEDDYPLWRRLEDLDASLSFPTSLRPIFAPPYVGIFTFELAVSDGCQVVTHPLVVEVLCPKCATSPRINAGHPEVLWNSADSYWNTLDLGSSIVDAGHAITRERPQLRWRVAAKNAPGVLIEQDPDYDRAFLAFRRLSPRRLVNQTSSTTTSTSPKYPSVQILGPPYFLDAPPYRVNELRTTVTTSTWTETTEVVTTTIYQNEVREEICWLYADYELSTSYQRLSFEEPGGNMATCPGEYAITLEAMGGCSKSASANDTTHIRLACPLPPRVLLGPTQRIEFNYNGGGFSYAYIDGSATHDPNPDTPSDGYHLRYSWALTSQPPNSNPELESATKSAYLYLDLGGNYVVELTASNGCNQAKGTTTIQAVCPKAAPKTAISTDRTTATFTAGPSPFQLTTVIDHDFPNAVWATWELVKEPAINPKVTETGFYTPSGSFDNSNNPNTTFRAWRNGPHVLRLTAMDGCQQPVAKELTVTHTCPSLTFSVTPTTSTLAFDYNTNSFPQVTLTATTTITSGGNAFYLSDAGQFGLYTSGTESTFSPDAPGTTTFRFITSDGCAYGFLDIPVTATCPETPVAVATATSLSVPIQTDVTLSAATSKGSIDEWEWTLLSDPYGDSGFVSSSQNFTFNIEGPGQYLFRLTVSDGCKTATTTITITGRCPTLPYTSVPTATPSSVWTNGHFARVDLDGRGSNLAGVDLDAYSFQWEVIEAPVGSVYHPSSETTFSLSQSNSTFQNSPTNNITIVRDTLSTTKEYTQVARRVFLTPTTSQPPQNFYACFYPDVVGQYRLTLTLKSENVMDACAAKVSEPVMVKAQCNQPPTISAADPEVELIPNVHTRIFLDASGTSDADNDQLSFLWEPIETNETLYTLEALSNANTSVASFIATRGGSFPFLLTVSDGCNVVTSTITVNLICPYADEIANSRKKQREAEKDMIEAKFSGVELSREAFTLTDSLLASTCVNEYTWELVDYDQSMLGQTEAFKGSSGYKAAIAVPVLIGLAVAIAAAALLAKKFLGSRRGPSEPKANDTKMLNLQDQSQPPSQPQSPPATPRGNHDPEY